MAAPILRPRIRVDIQKKAERILEELGSPEPPLQLEEVRDLLDLDRSYFTGESDGLFKKAFSRLKRAGKQLLRRPTLLGEAVKKFDLRALYLPDRRHILIDDSVPKPKHRWLEAHEIGHDILPWHHEMMLGDDDLTPTASVHDKMEAEANFAAGCLLFMGGQFISECKDMAPTMKSVQALKKRYGNTFTTTFWRLIEHAGEDVPMLGLIGLHPKEFGTGKPDFRHLIPSPAFNVDFTIPSVQSMADAIAGYSYKSRGTLGESEFLLNDRDGDQHLFSFETFYNGYDALTLAVHMEKVAVSVAV